MKGGNWKRAENSIVAIGMGMTETGEGSSVLRETTLREIDVDETCPAAKDWAFTYEKQVCLISPDKQSNACRGDSGGPLFPRLSFNVLNFCIEQS